MRPRDPHTDAQAPSPDFGPATASWFSGRFGAPTKVQAEGWPAIARGQHALLCAPTGSGKTLAAFLAAIDRLTRTAGPAGVRVLYVSPLKALAHDVERNLRHPLEGIAAEAARLGIGLAPARVAIRTGDTSAKERRRIAREPDEILITTPESLYLMLGSEARRVLRGVETVIVDEIHALAPTKRGAHLALSLERLSALIAEASGRDPQRIGLSATQRPLDEVARFLGGARPVTIVDAGERPRLELLVEVPVEELERPAPPPRGAERAGEEAAGVWPALHARVLELVAQHRSTIVFANSRRLCERVAQRLNELWAERGHDEVLVRAHHGSLARERRVEIEELLKQGRLRGIVATSSLELGIDMGAVDLVIQIESPGSVSRGLQRVGRAGHSISERSIARLFPKFRQDLLESAVVARRMLDGEVEPIRVPRNALDVLAQQLVAITSDGPRSVEALYTLVRGAYPYQTLSRELLGAVLAMLAGQLPGDELAELRPRLIWDRASDRVEARRDARLIAIVNAGTIPDRGLYGVYLEGGGPRVGELDEEMVHETRVGQTFLLGASSWRVVEITRDRVLVRPAPGEPGRMPFWRGEGPGRPIELGRALGAFLRELEPRLAEPAEAQRHLRERYALDERAAANLCRYLEDERAATGRLVSDRVLVAERYRDELGDWRVCLLSPFGARVHAPLALLLEARLSARSGHEAQALYTDDGIVLRLPDAEAPPALRALLPAPEEVEGMLLAQLRQSALFASHFRENAARALLLPRRAPGRRTPLWAQRLRAQSLLAVASRHPSFPIVLETFRECLNDVFDLPALLGLLGELRAGVIELVEVETSRPSPFARSLALDYVASYVYEGDAPLAERRAQALTLDRELLRELLGEVEMRALLEPEVLASVEAELQGLAPERRARSADGLHDLLRRTGDLSSEELAARSETDPAPLLRELRQSGRAVKVRIGGAVRTLATEDAARYRDGLGVVLPPGLPEALLAPTTDALPSLILRYAHTHGPFTAGELAARWGQPTEAITAAIRGLLDGGRLLEGAFRPEGTTPELCDPDVLRRLRRTTLARLRREIAPLDAGTLARFLPGWHRIDAPGPPADLGRLRDALSALEGVPLPFAELEGRILPARLPGYQPRMLDELSAAGEIVWLGRGALGEDGRVALYLRAHAPLLAPAPGPIEAVGLAAEVLEALERRGASFFAALQAAMPSALTQALEDALWALVWAGLVSNDTFAPLRARSIARRSRVATRRRPGAVRISPMQSGRWFLTRELRPGDPEPTSAAHAQASSLLARHGIVTREAAQAEELPGGFSAIADVMRAMEDAGQLRRGYFVEGLSGAQYALPRALDQLRAAAAAEARPLLLSAVDPANPYGIFLDWPLPDGAHGVGRARRAAGALVILVEGRPVLFLERGGRKLLVLGPEAEARRALPGAVAALSALSPQERASLRITEVNGQPALRSPWVTPLEAAGLRVEPGGLVLR